MKINLRLSSWLFLCLALSSWHLPREAFPMRFLGSWCNYANSDSGQRLCIDISPNIIEVKRGFPLQSMTVFDLESKECLIQESDAQVRILEVIAEDTISLSLLMDTIMNNEALIWELENQGQVFGHSSRSINNVLFRDL